MTFGSAGSVATLPSIDKKEAAIRKLVDQVSKADFRHWADALDIQLDVVHHLTYAEIVLGKARRQTNLIFAKGV